MGTGAAHRTAYMQKRLNHNFKDVRSSTRALEPNGAVKNSADFCRIFVCVIPICRIFAEILHFCNFSAIFLQFFCKNSAEKIKISAKILQPNLKFLQKICSLEKA